MNVTYFATRPEVEGFRDQGFVASLSSREEGARHQFINSKARFK